MSEEQKPTTDQQQRSEMHRIDDVRNTGVQLARRDAELYIALGIFIVALGLPVIFGTVFTLQSGDIRPAVVNFICGLVMTLIGVGSIFYGFVIRKRIAS
ncbi:MAG TPA: hypothetical protein PLT82_10910 [Candidatus Hydrogenedens sp.]|nr:YtpI family protein [Candidatus Hydrogenedens sp.]HOK10057.1 hypothetical protein [Candidatus Hydrogenedens sp.]HOL20223.1 hypothetical protein [Candidatus Hydrogenedens sp.]HPP59632.1 hypothetical protein [Candidatus Hydrogenedens sp.]